MGYYFNLPEKEERTSINKGSESVMNTYGGDTFRIFYTVLDMVGLPTKNKYCLAINSLH